MQLNDIDKGYAELFGAIWKQAVQDDYKENKDVPLKIIQKCVLYEANKWRVRR
jgi:hypothetical protein